MRPILSVLLIYFCFSCSNTPESGYLSFEGKTMGTYYKVTYAINNTKVEQEEIDQLLVDINKEVSTYIDTSTISKFNKAEEQLVLDASNLYSSLDKKISGHFMANFMAAKEIFQQSKGYFDPTVMPLVNYWGFGYTEKKPVEAIDSIIIDSLLKFVGFQKVTMTAVEPYTIKKERAGVQLDFSAIAKGYAVDVIAKLLESYDVEHYLVDIGGELRAKGQNANAKTWTVGINVPKEDAGTTELQTAIPLKNLSIATSGNYRNFYEVNGQKFSHTINPNTGFPERSRLLSASVFTEDCMVADAFATAFMTMGLEKAYEMANTSNELEAYFIYGKEDGAMGVKYTEGLKAVLEDN
jgi:thiamine biosynthesis lipoprotein